MKTTKNAGVFSDFELSVLRYYAIPCLLLGSVLLSVNLAGMNEDGGHSWPRLISMFVNSVTIIAATALLFKPGMWALFTATHALQGLKLWLWNGEVFGAAIYFTGWLIAYKAGFFRHSCRQKIAAVVIIFLAPSCYELRISYSIFFADLGKIVFCSCMLILIVVLFRKKLSVVKIETSEETGNPNNALILSKYVTDNRELCYVYGLQHGFPYKWLEQSLFISESTVKHGMRELFKKFNVKSNAELKALLSKQPLIYPEDFDAPVNDRNGDEHNTV